MYFLLFIIWELVRFVYCVCVCVCLRVHNPVCLPTAMWVLTAVRAVECITCHATSSVSYCFGNFIMGDRIVIT